MKIATYKALTLETNDSSDKTAKFFSIRSLGIEMIFSLSSYLKSSNDKTPSTMEYI